MNLIVGLGNPGREHASTRHNVGFMVLDRLARRYSLEPARQKFHGRVAEGHVKAERTTLLWPATYMNRSGLSVSEAVRFYKLQPTQWMVVVDDTALPPGTIRLRPSGSAGSHNGLADIEAAVGTRDYPRLRVGIGSPKEAGESLPQREYVLRPFSETQWRAVVPALEVAADALECWLEEGIQPAMSRFNGAVDGERERSTGT